MAVRRAATRYPIDRRVRVRIKVKEAVGNSRGQVTEQARAAVRRRATELRIAVAEAETILVTAKFLVEGRETLARSEDLQTKLERKVVVRVAPPV